MKEKKEQSKLKEMWKNPQKKALIKLGLWFAFFALTFIFLSIASLFNNNSTKNIDSKSTEVNEEVLANIPKMLENLIISDYSYEFKITSLEKSYSYTGTKESSENEGYYESDTGIIKYSVIDDVYYQLNDGELKENQNIISQEDKELFSLEKILEKVKEYELNNEVINENNKYSYELIDDEILWKVDIYTNGNYINEIKLSSNDFNYDLVYKNIVRKNN